MKALDEFIRYSQSIGREEDLIQGAGGNTSVKLGKNRMAIKSSGRRLIEVSRERGYVTVDHQALIEQLQVTNILEPVAQENDFHSRLKQTIIGTSTERPSMETAMHALLPKHVVHTHAVYVNVFTCMDEGQASLLELFGNEQPVFIPYATPGHALASEVAKNIRKRTPRSPLFLTNHGLLTGSKQAAGAYTQSRDINAACWAAIHKILPVWPRFASAQLTPYETSDGTYFQSKMPVAWNYLAAITSVDRLIEQCCFPDAVVFCAKNLLLTSAKHWEAAKREFQKIHGYLPTIQVITDQGVYYRGAPEMVRSVQAIFETLIYIQATIQALGRSIQSLSQAQQAILLSLDSEKYRVNQGAA